MSNNNPTPTQESDQVPPHHHHHLIHNTPPPLPVALLHRWTRHSQNRARCARFQLFSPKPPPPLLVCERSGSPPPPHYLHFPTTSPRRPPSPLDAAQPKPSQRAQFPFFLLPTPSPALRVPTNRPTTTITLPTSTQHPTPSFPLLFEKAHPKPSHSRSVSSFWPTANADGSGITRRCYLNR